MKWSGFKRLDLLWWLLLGGHLLVVWATPHFLTQDGSAHLYTASVFIQLMEGDSPHINQFFEWNDWFVPTWGGGMMLVMLVKLFGFFTAEKVFISLILVTIACGYRALLRKLCVNHVWAPFLILPFLFNQILLMGLYFYLLAVGLSLLLLARYLDKISELDWRKALPLGLSFLFLFYIHPIPPALAGVALLIFSLMNFLAIRERRYCWEHMRGIIWLLISSLPCLMVALIYVSNSPDGGVIQPGRGLVIALKEVLSVSFLVTFQTTPQWWSVLCAGVVVVLTLRVLIGIAMESSWGKTDVWLILALAVFVLIAWVPEGMTGGSLISLRLHLILWVAWLVWLGSRLNCLRIPWLPHAAGIAFMVATIMQMVTTHQNMAKIQPLLSALQQVTAKIPDHNIVWPVVMNPQGEMEGGGLWAPRNHALAHSGLRFLAGRKDLASGIAYQGEVGHFMTRYRLPAPSGYYKQGFSENPAAFQVPEQIGGWVIYIGVTHEMQADSLKQKKSQSTKFGSINLLNNKRLHQ